MCERGLARREASARVAVLALIAGLAIGVAPANARRGCHARCRQLASGGSGGGGGGGGGSQPARRMALLTHTVHLHGHSVDVKLRCLRQHHPCRGVITLHSRNAHARELARVRLSVPAGKARRISVRLSDRRVAYLGDLERTRVILRLVYPGHHRDLFRMTIIG
jgi:hypothetical protein